MRSRPRLPGSEGMMCVLTRALAAKKAADRFEAQYRNSLDSPGFANAAQTRGDILGDLRALGPAPNPDQVNAVIGNNSWTDIGNCHNCGRDAAILAQVGEEPDYESNTANICLECAKAVVAMLTEAEE